MARATETHHLMMPHLKEIKQCYDQPCSLIKEGAPCKPSPASVTWKPSEESFYKDNLRIEAAFCNHIHRADKNEESNYTSLFVCHGNVIRYFVCRALQIPGDHWLRLSLYNASITVLDIHSNGNVSLKILGDVGFLQPTMITYD